MKRIILIVSLAAHSLWTQGQTMSLEDCIAYAVNNNFGIGKQITESEIAKINYQESLMSHLPEISGNIGTNSAYGRGIDPETNSYVNTATFNNGYSVGAYLPVFNGFSMINRTRAARVAKQRGVEQVRMSKDQVALSTMIAYAEVLFHKELVALYEERIAEYGQQLEQLTRKEQLGVSSRADLAQAKAALSSKQYEHIQAMNNYELSIIKLKDQMNYPLNKQLMLSEEIGNSRTTHETNLADLLSVAIQINPSVASARQMVEIQRLSLLQARGKYSPSLSLRAGLSSSFFRRLDTDAFSPFSTQLRNNFGQWIGATLSIPIFSGLQRKSEVARAKHRYNQAKEDHKQTVREIESAVMQAAMEAEASQSRWLQAQRNVEYQRLANAASKRKFEQGLIDMISMQTSDNELFQSQAELKDSYLRHHLKQRELEYYNGTSLY